MPWSPALESLFGPILSGWTAPDAAQVYCSADNMRHTWKARFRLADGSAVTVTIRTRRDRHAGMTPVSETLEPA